MKKQAKSAPVRGGRSLRKAIWIRAWGHRLRVLVSKVPEGYLARVLEMDLVGLGSSARAAVAELRGTIDAQFRFAGQFGQRGLIWFKADRRHFAAWRRAAALS